MSVSHNPTVHIWFSQTQSMSVSHTHGPYLFLIIPRPISVSHNHGPYLFLIPTVHICFPYPRSISGSHTHGPYLFPIPTVHICFPYPRSMSVLIFKRIQHSLEHMAVSQEISASVRFRCIIIQSSKPRLGDNSTLLDSWSGRNDPRLVV